MSYTPTYVYSYSAGTGGSIEGPNYQSIPYGTQGTEVIADPDPGYQFDSWSDGATGASRQDVSYDHSNLTAYFSLISTPPPTTYTLTYTAEVGGSIDGSANQTVTAGETGSPVTAQADSGYVFSQWSDGATGASRQDVADSNKGFTASFVSIPTDISLNSSTIAENAGTNAVVGTLSTTGGVSSYTYSLVSGVGDSDNSSFNVSGSNLRANSSLNYESKNSYSVRIQVSDSNNNTFSKSFTITVTNVVESYTLTYSTGTGGSVIGTTTQTVNENTSGTGVTAVANAGYVFSQWSDGATGAYRVDSIVNQNKGFTASFSVLSVNIQGNSLTSVVSLPSGTLFQFTDPQVNLTQETKVFSASSGVLPLGATGASGPQVAINSADSTMRYVFSSISDSTKNSTLSISGSDFAFVLKVINSTTGAIQTSVNVPIQLYLDSNVGTVLELSIPATDSNPTAISAGSGTYGGLVGDKHLYNCTLTRGDGAIVGSGSTPAPSAGSDPHITTIFGKKYDFHPSTRKNYTLFKTKDVNVSSHFTGLKSGVYYDTVKIDLPNKDSVKVDFNKHSIKGSSSFVSVTNDIPDVKYENKTSDKNFAKLINPKMMKKISVQGKNPVDMYVDFQTRYVHFRFPDKLPSPSEMSGLIVEPATRLN
jgi:hypothetical protein